MKLTVVTPVRNEQGCIKKVVEDLVFHLENSKIPYEFVLVNDGSTDNTPVILDELSRKNPSLKIVNNLPPNGFGRAIKKGLDAVTGGAVVIFMGDGSDDSQDVINYYNKLLEGFDCVFGSRFMRGSKITGYPKLKLVLNRFANKVIQLLFLLNYNDVSNAFKAYRIDVIKSVQPLVSQYFNITVEIPLKAIIRGYKFAVIPINWNGRESGVSKYNIRVLSRKYFFSIMYVWLEKLLLKEEIRKS